MLLIVVGIVLLYFGAEGLVRGSSNLAMRAGVHPLVVGLTVVAFGTSAPELTVSASAALQGLGSVALGNVVGSNIFNIGIILGLAALICPLTIHIDLIRRDIPIMVAVAAVGCLLVVLGEITRWAGLILLALLVAYVVYTVRLSLRASRLAAAQEVSLPESPRSKLWLDLLMVAAGLGLLVWGANLFVDGSLRIARSLGVSEAIIGLTIVAAGTSLPELATSVVAALKRQSDIAVGNVVGSNIFNILGILGATSLLQPIAAPEIGLRDGGVMLALSLILLPLAFTQRSVSRWEGLVLLLLYGAYLAWLWPK